jgi:hypothetical protein
MFDFFKKKPAPNLPPVPEWKPDIPQPLERIIERLRHYTDGKRDFAVFEHGTCVVLADGLSELDAETSAKETLSKIFHFHPDMNPQQMKDGNVLVQYNHPAVNVVLNDVAQTHWSAIESNHQKALATSEVLMTPLGQNVFDAFGKKALFGRCFMFMDAVSPKVVKIVRRTI